MSGEDLTWALLAPVPRKRLAGLAKEYWRQEVGDDEDYKEEGWEVVGGTGEYSAILDRNPGSEATHETQLAERISRNVKGPVYVVYLGEDYADADAVPVYKGGRQTGAKRAPYAVARSLGIALPGDPTAEKREAIAKPLVHGVLLVEGVRAVDVARALGMSTLPRGPLHIEDGSAGAIVHNEETGSVSVLMRRLSTAFPRANVFSLSTGPGEGRFLAKVVRGGEDIGTLEIPAPAQPKSSPVLDSVKGQTTPQGIAQALGIPVKLLDLQESK